MKPDKAVYLTPCNGCGLCCLAVQCSISLRIFGEAERCPALVDASDRYACGLIVHPDRYFVPGHEAESAREVGELLGIGTFCDAFDPTNAADRFSDALAYALGVHPFPLEEASPCANG